MASITALEKEFLKAFRGDELLIGMQSFSGSPPMIEAMGSAGLNFVTIDMEHSPAGIAEVVAAIRAAQTAGIAPFVRIPEMNASLLGRVLDLGARGVVVPHASLDTCRAAVDAAKYVPAGHRGACPIIRAAGYAPADWNKFADEANQSTLIIPLLEDARSVDELDAMLALPGVDALFIGPWDLSLSLGIPGANYEHPTLGAVLDEAVAAARRHGKRIMTTVAATIDGEYASRLVGRGVSLLSFSADIMVFLDACRRIAAVRAPLQSASATQ